MLSPTTTYIIHTLASNVVSENLINDNRIEVDFVNNIITNLSLVRNMKEQIEDDGSFISSFCRTSHTIDRTLAVINSYKKGYFESILDKIKTDIVLVTCWNSFSIPFIRFLLDNGKKVVIGGVLCNSYPFEHIRNLIGNTNNLMIVRGFVDLTTDLYSLIEKWKDVEITNNDFKTMWYATKDHIKDNINIARTIKGNQIFYTVVFNNGCWYKKCTFCNIEDQCEINFIRDIDKDTLVEYILQNLREYKTKGLYINNPYLIFTDKVKYVLGRLRQEGIEIAIQTGITLLNNKRYIDNLNRYTTEIRVGLESCSDFSLAYINKGYGWKEIKESTDTITKNLAKHVKIRYLYIMDLAEKNREGVLENYRRLDTLEERFKDFDFLWFPRNLHIFKDAQIHKNKDFIKITQNSPNVSGIWTVYNYLSKFFEVNIPESVVVPFERYDDSGKLLPSDYYIRRMH